jgi:hypothetical protein
MFKKIKINIRKRGTLEVLVDKKNELRGLFKHVMLGQVRKAIKSS